MVAVSRFAVLSFVAVLLGRISGRLQKSGVVAGLCGVLVASVLGTPGAASAQTKTATVTTLALSSGGSPVTTVGAWSVVTLTAHVNGGSSALTTGQVKFCDATAVYCTDIHVLGAVQLTSAGSATLKFRPGVGSHSYKAVFTGTNTYAGSSSNASALTVTIGGGQSSAATLLSSTGSWGNYNLTATVEAFGSTAPITGSISFQDTSNGNAVLATAPLGASTQSLFWALQAPCMNTYGTNATVIADFDGDGYMDLATLDARAQEIHIVVYQPILGCYQQTATYAISTSPTAFIVADFNSDGIPDLAVASGSSNTLTILLGNGDGTFAQSTVPAGIVNTALVSADFNGDGIPDLAVANEFSQTVAILLGKGDGTFTTGPTLSVSPAESLAAGDFNGDGKVDLVVVATGGIDIFTGNGDGTFGVPSTVSVPGSSYISQVVAGDFNGDGKVDVAVSNGTNVVPSTGQVVVMLGNGDGTFTAATPSTTPDAGLQLAVADFNLDGIPDIAELNSAGIITVLIGRGDGTFLSPPYTATTNEFILDQGFAVGDVDGDGRPDIIFPGEYPPNSIVIYFGLNKPMETASTAPISISPSGAGQHLVVANYPGDPNTTAQTSDPISLWGTLPATTTTLTLTANGSPASTVSSGTVVSLTATVGSAGAGVTTGQVNFCDATAHDCLDMHLVGQAQLTGNGTASLKLVPGPGQHSYKAILVENGYAAPSSSSAVTLTVNPPAIVISSTTTAIAQSGTVGAYSLTATVTGIGSTAALTGSVSFLDTSYSNTAVATAALGASTPGMNWNSQSSTAFTDGQSVAGDFNGDGIPDLAVVSENSMAITILMGNGDGTFKTIAGPPSTTYPTAIVAGDFNGDGKLDLAVSSTAGNYNSPGILTIFLGNGDGTFTAGYSATGVDGVFSAADFNGDGKIDLLVNQGTTSTVVLIGNGDGTFATGTTVGAFQTLAVADLNGDSIPDLVVSFVGSTNGYYSTTTGVYLGNGDGTFRAGPALQVSESFGHIAAGDFNGDGIPDLVGISIFGVSPVVFLGKGDGTFTQVTVSSIPSSGDGQPSSIALADFNGDGKLDIVTTNGNSYSGFGSVDSLNPDFLVFLGNGDGTFIPLGANTALGSTGYAIVADFDGTGVPELAMQAGQNLVVLQPVPTETATATANGVAPTGPAPHLVTASYPGDINYAASTSGTTSLSVQAATPVISPAPGIITTAEYIMISDPTPGVTIYYSAFGAVSTNGYVPYTAPIPLAGSGTVSIQAYATETGYQQSGYSSATYTLNFTTPVATPTISLASGLYPSAQTVTISDTNPGAQIYYTTDGTFPYTYSNLYTGPITVSSTEIVTAVAIAPGFLASGFATAQYDIATSSTRFIYTIAGSYTFGNSGDGGPATFAQINNIQGVAVDAAGNVYLADSADNVVRKVSASTGIITTISGTGVAGHTGDNGPATSAELWTPTSLAVDAAGNLYIGETGDNVVRRIDAGTGNITTFAGNPSGTGTFGGSATNYSLIGIGGIALDLPGANLYIANGFNVVGVDIGNGVISLPQGLNSYPSFGYLDGITVDGANNIYVSDSTYNVVRKISPTGTTTVFAGTAYYGPYGGDGGLATNARLSNPGALASDRAGNIYIADSWDYAIREVNTSGIINTIAGILDDSYAEGGDGSPATTVGFSYPQFIASDAAGNIYLSDQGTSRVRKITVPTTPPSTVAAAPVLSLSTGTYFSPQTLTMSDATPGAEIYVSLNGSAPTTANQGYHGPIDITGTVTVQAIALAPGYQPSAAVTATYTFPTPPTAVISTVAGNGKYGFLGFGGPATSASLEYPQAVALDGDGNLYIADSGNCVVWMVAASTGNISVVAGTGTYGGGGDGGLATATELASPYGVAVDKAGNLYIADTNNGRIRMVAAQTGVITTIAGPGVYSTIGDGGPAISAYLGYPDGLAIDATGNLYIADANLNRIRMIAANTGIISTVAGGGTTGQLGDGGLATAAYISYPTDVAVDSLGNLYIPDVGNERIRKVTASTGEITTIAGIGVAGTTGDGGPAVAAEINVQQGITVDGAGNVYFTDTPDTIRRIDATTGIITTIAGNGYFGFGGDGGAATEGELYYPQGLALDSAGSLYIADDDNSLVRKVTFPAAAPAPSFSLAAGTYVGAQAVTISDSIPSTAIYYTIDGSTPTTASNLYSGSITVSSTETLQAIAVVKGYTESAVTSAAYTINQPITPAITWATPAAITYGTALGAAQLDATSPVAGTFAYTPAAGTVLLAGTQTLSVTLTPTDTTDYTTATATVTFTVNKATPLITETTSASGITTAQALTVTIDVSAGNSSQTPTGSVTLSCGGYTSAATPLGSGGAIINIPAGSLAVGSDALVATYTPDTASAGNYTNATQSATVAVSQAIGTAIATVTVTPSAPSILNDQSLTVQTAVAGASGQAIPTGTVTLTSGTYSSVQALSGGTASFNISVGSLSSGSDTLTATYSGDPTYAVASGTVTVTVAPVTIAIPAPSIIYPGNIATATATFTAGTNYSGTMNLACALTSSPSGAQSLPTCTLNPVSITLSSGGNATTTLTIDTTLASPTPLARSHRQNLLRLGEGGALLAGILGFFLPSRRRRWISMLALTLMIAGAGVIGCGGGNRLQSTGPGTASTTAGNYTFTVTGTDSANAKITVSTTVTITVQ